MASHRSQEDENGSPMPVMGRPVHALQVVAMQQHNHRLLGHCKRLERQKDVLMAQVHAIHDKWSDAEATRTHLLNEVCTLRKTLEVSNPRSHEV